MKLSLSSPPKLFNTAQRLAHTSDYGRFRLGAVIAQKNNIVSLGVNAKKTHPLQEKFKRYEHLDAWLHAEIHAISLARTEDLIDADIYVARVLQNGNPAASRPCFGCMRALEHYGIRRAFYYQDGEYHVERIAA